MLLMAVLGFSSGLPVALTGGTLQVWMAKTGIDLHTIGIFSLVGVPYALKFLWSPVMDRFVPPWLGRRRGWIILVQLVLFLGIAAFMSRVAYADAVQPMPIMVTFTVLHVAVGALTMASSVALAILVRRNLTSPALAFSGAQIAATP